MSKTNLIEVWAPQAKRVDLALAHERLPMQACKKRWGWWALTLDFVPEGYSYYLDDKGPYPDPRSGFQAQGVHGPSGFQAQALSRDGMAQSCRQESPAYAWRCNDFQACDLAQAIIYELHIGTFTEEGSFLSAIKALDHLLELGVTHVELLPLAQFPGRWGWGYDGVQLFAPFNAYCPSAANSADSLKAFIDACHQRGLAVILDVVYNHLGPNGNYLGQFGPYFNRRYATPWGEALNFDGDNSPEVRQFFVDNALYWLSEFRFDGLRLDAVQTILDDSALHILEEIGAAVEQLGQATGRRLCVIAESHMNDAKLLRPRPQGFGLDAQWHDDFHHSVATLISSERAGYFQDYAPLTALVKTLTRGVYFDGQYCQYRKRHLGRPATGLSGCNFISYIQNHDQVGNRPDGLRLARRVGLERAKLAAALLLTSPFTPMLFQGEEWAASSPFYYFTDHQDETLNKAIERGRKQEAKAFGWSCGFAVSPSDPKAFEASKLNWCELTEAEHGDMLLWYRQLLALRRHHPDLQSGAFIEANKIYFDEDQAWLAFKRGSFAVVFNFAASERSLSHKDLRLDLALKPEQWQVRLSSSAQSLFSEEQVQLAPYSVLILQEI